MTLFAFYENMLQFSGRSCSYKNGALLAKFQPGVLNTFVLICGCLLYSEFDLREPIKFLSDVWVYLSKDLNPVLNKSFLLV